MHYQLRRSAQTPACPFDHYIVLSMKMGFVSICLSWFLSWFALKNHECPCNLKLKEAKGDNKWGWYVLNHKLDQADCLVTVAIVQK